MKCLSLFLGLGLISIVTYSQNGVDSTFQLSYHSIGLGSNLWKMQPMFRVRGSQFIYTLEEAWQSEGLEKTKPDTLLIGKLRPSSIDSIIYIAGEIRADSVYKLNPRVMSGGIINLDIYSNQHTLSFELDNSYDETAKRIVDILNGYIPEKYRKLWIADIEPEIIEVK